MIASEGCGVFVIGIVYSTFSGRASETQKKLHEPASSGQLDEEEDRCMSYESLPPPMTRGPKVGGIHCTLLDLKIIILFLHAPSHSFFCTRPPPPPPRPCDCAGMGLCMRVCVYVCVRTRVRVARWKKIARINQRTLRGTQTLGSVRDRQTDRQTGTQAGRWTVRHTR